MIENKKDGIAILQLLQGTWVAFMQLI